MRKLVRLINNQCGSSQKIICKVSKSNPWKYPIRMSGLLVITLLVFGLNVTAYAQTASRTITGKITDDAGEPLIGVNVAIKGTNLGSVSDINGAYRINVASANAILVFRYLGFTTIERTVGESNVINVQLKEAQNSLDEVVVIGYGTTTRRDLTGSVSTLKGEDLIANNPISVNQGLQGMIAGVEVNRNDGAPGAGISLTIRGANSFSGSEPLYVVDDIPVTSAGLSGDAGNSQDDAKQTVNPLAFLNPQDIESIEILKDASATAIYGSRGANGVVLIRTKKGKVGKDQVEFIANTSLSSITNKIELLGAYDYARRVNEVRYNGFLYEDLSLSVPFSGTFRNDPVLTNVVTYVPTPEDFLTGVPAGSLTYPEGFKGTDWMDMILREAISQDYTLRVSGGSDKGTYSLSGNYTDQQGIIKKSGYKRYGAQFNIDRNVSKIFKVGLNTNVNYSQYQLVKTNTVQTQSNLINSAMSYPSIYAFSDPYSDLREELAGNQRVSNPYNSVMGIKDLTNSVRVYTTGFAQVNFTPWLNFRQRFGYNYNSNERENYIGRNVHQGRPPTNGRAAIGENSTRQLTLESLLSFNKTFAKDHKISGVVAFAYEKGYRNLYELTATNFPSDITQNFDIGAGLNQRIPNSLKEDNALMSYLGRINYSYRSRYIFTVNFRRDGSSKFREENWWSNFGSAAFAWNAHDEDFIKNLNVFSGLKLRTSFGTTGNQGVNPYTTKFRMESVNSPGITQVSSGYVLNKNLLPDPNLKWETTYQADIGLDMSFLKDRLAVTIDVYNKDTRDLLQNMTLAPSTGFGSMQTNFATVNNKGLEVSVYGTPIIKPSFSWKVNGNIAFNRNKIKGLLGDNFLRLYTGMESAMILRNGQPIGSIYGMVEDGFYDNEAEVRADPRWKNVPDHQLKYRVGEIKYVNIDGDEAGTISASNDRTVIGNTTPDYTFGLTNTLQYKKFTFSFFWQGTVGNDILNTNSIGIRMGELFNFPKFAFDGRWTPETATTATWPRLTASNMREMFFSDRNVEDGSFIRLKTINFGYTFNPRSVFSAIYLYGSVNNILTFTNYSWFDPDVNSFASDASRRGVDMNAYPNSRTFNLGIRASL